MEEVTGPEAQEGSQGLVARELRKRLGGRAVVDGLDLAVAPGQIVGLLGPNGAGKTTTFALIMGWLRADGGQVFLDAGPDLMGRPMFERARAGLGYLAQEPSVFRGLSVRDNILAVLQARASLCDSKGTHPRAEREARAEAVLTRLGLAALTGRRAGTLSSGERRRLEIARALAIPPRVLLLDEPFAQVDPRGIEELQRLLAELAADGLGLLITDHNVRDTLRITHRACIIHEGRRIAAGSPKELLEDALVRRHYLGDRFEL